MTDTTKPTPVIIDKDWDKDNKRVARMFNKIIAGTSKYKRIKCATLRNRGVAALNTIPDQEQYKQYIQGWAPPRPPDDLITNFMSLMLSLPDTSIRRVPPFLMACIVSH